MTKQPLYGGYAIIISKHKMKEKIKFISEIVKRQSSQLLYKETVQR